MEVARVEIPNYIRKVQISASRKIKYYEEGKALPKSKKYTIYNGDKPVLINSGYGYRDYYVGKKKKRILVDLKTGFPIIANPNSHGTPRTYLINGQDLWNGTLSKHTRNKVKDEIDKQIDEYIPWFSILDKSNFPIGITLEFHNKIGEYDLDNHSLIYRKVIGDSLKYWKIIPDDNVRYIQEWREVFVESDNPKIVIIISKI